MSQGLCPSCGAAVSLPAGQSETKCEYCETVVTVQQAEAQLSEVKNSKSGGTLLLAELARKSGKYAEALRHYNNVIGADEKNAEAWLGNAFCTLRTYWCPTRGSGFSDDDFQAAARDSDMAAVLIPCQTAINCAKNPGAMKKRLAKEIALVAAAWVQTATRGIVIRELQGHGFDAHQLLKLLEFALQTDPLSEYVAQTAVTCVKVARERLREEERVLAKEEAEASKPFEDWMDEEDIEEQKEEKKVLEGRRRSLSELKAAWKIRQGEWVKALGAINPEAAIKHAEKTQKRTAPPKPKLESPPQPQARAKSGGIFEKLKKLFE